MKPVHVLILAVLVAVAGFAVWQNSKPEPDSASETQLLLPGLAETLDAIDQVSLRNAGGVAVVIEKKDGDWRLAAKPRYYVETTKLGQLLVAVSEARPVEQKTANPELYSRLGLKDIEDPQSGAVLLSVSATGQTYDLLLGNASDRFGGSTFVRRPGEAQSYLATPSLRAEVSADAWLDKSVFDFTTDEIQSVRVTRADGSVTEISKSAMFNSDFELTGRSENQVLNDAAVRGLARGLTGLTFDDVVQGVAFAFNDYQRVQVTYSLFSGVIINLTLFYKESEESEESEEDASGPPREPVYYVNASAQFDEALAQRFVPQPDGSGEDGEPAERLTLTPADLADRRAQVERINETRKPWVYRITKARFDSINRSTESLIVPAS